MMPGYGNGTTPEPMFTPAFLQQLAAVFGSSGSWTGTRSTIRRSPTGPIASPPTDFITDRLGRRPYEDMIELCNEAQKDMWINIPALATPQFVQSLAQLIYANLDPNLNVYVEYGNENWNYGFYADCTSVRTPPRPTRW